VLVAHGSQDGRVDPDHAHRLRAMLDLHGKPYEWLELHESGHSLTPGDMQTFARMLRKFLRKHLAPTSPALASGRQF
jgi:dipeptidyl aminopeptidase/acylaminoacyl peptidase